MEWGSTVANSLSKPETRTDDQWHSDGRPLRLTGPLDATLSVAPDTVTLTYSDQAWRSLHALRRLLELTGHRQRANQAKSIFKRHPSIGVVLIGEAHRGGSWRFRNKDWPGRIRNGKLYRDS